MPLITINQMQKYYGDNHVLKGVDLDIDMGEVISIIGRSGSGKSTLLRCINGLEGVPGGEHQARGHDHHRPRFPRPGRSAAPSAWCFRTSISFRT